MSGGTILYSFSGTFAVVKLVNNITWESSVELSTLLLCLLKELNLNTLYLDCSETSYLDSTILGTLVHFKKKSDNENLSITISSPSSVCDALLTDVGLNKVFKIENNLSPVMEIVNELPLGRKIPPLEIEQLIKEAHEELMLLNKKNKDMFSPVVDTFNNQNLLR